MDILILSSSVHLRAKIFRVKERIESYYIEEFKGEKNPLVLNLNLKYHYAFIRYFIFK